MAGDRRWCEGAAGAGTPPRGRVACWLTVGTLGFFPSAALLQLADACHQNVIFARQVPQLRQQLGAGSSVELELSAELADLFLMVIEEGDEETILFIEQECPFLLEFAAKLLLLGNGGAELALGTAQGSVGLGTGLRLVGHLRPKPQELLREGANGSLSALQP